MTTTAEAAQDRQSAAIDLRLNELLVMWHRHQQGYRLSAGYSSSDATCRDFRTPGHWDWQNGASASRADDLEVQAIKDAMERIPNTPHRWHTALAFQARNLATGFDVWHSPVLPKTEDEREVLLMEARTKLLIQLRRDGAIG
ncbi:hypothetical protein RD110_15655 [Rhodoferax koreense]|uniref:Uncharacterized protein n=1 Tax=Rhodoferax koreensis TaxID=1842727 RepID=A0A1P8JXJ2_9BURK|nr:hypothetical protein [Rhodoferax koreense]APW38458.1 hypothetical protein RD110_15655 [Rhodoferax koreense]